MPPRSPKKAPRPPPRAPKHPPRLPKTTPNRPRWPPRAFFVLLPSFFSLSKSLSFSFSFFSLRSSLYSLFSCLLFSPLRFLFYLTAGGSLPTGWSWGGLGVLLGVLGGLGRSWGGLGAPWEAPGWLLGCPGAIQNRSKNRSETCFENRPNRDGKKWPKHYACRCFRA